MEVIIGKAGSGKSTALKAAGQAWQSAGIPVAGAVLAARAALQLQQAAGIPTTTLARLLGQLRHGDPAQAIAAYAAHGRLTTADTAEAARHLASTDRARPANLTTALGPPPADRHRHRQWQKAGLAIEPYRLRWNVTDPHRALGPPPGDPLQRQDHHRVALAIQHHHNQGRDLTRRARQGPQMTLSR